MKKSFKRKLLLLFCCLYIATDIGRISLVVNAENKREISMDQKSEITISGVDDIELEVGSIFDPLSKVEALDKNGVNITSSLNVSGNIDVNRIGDYELIYTVKDEVGESKDIIRNIKVTDKKEIITEKLDESAQVGEVNGWGVSEVSPDDMKDEEVNIIGVKNLTIKLGETIDLMNGIEAFDNKGNDITKFVKIGGEVDFNKVGDYKVKYFIDNEGVFNREAERNITVVDSENIINIYTDEEKIEDKKLAFSIIFSEKEKKFIVVNKSDEELSTRDSEKNIFNLNIFDKNNKLKLNLDLLGKDRALVDNSNVNKKFEKFEKLTYEEGDLIEIEIPNHKYGMDIQGDVLGDITKDKEIGRAHV